MKSMAVGLIVGIVVSSIMLLVGLALPAQAAVSFNPLSPISLLEYPWGQALGDFNRDGKGDMAVLGSSGGSSSDKIYTYFGNGDGTFTYGWQYNANGISTLYCGDFDRDGILDLVGANTSTGEILFFKGSPSGDFSPPVASWGGLCGWGRLALGDFNGDGIPDLAAANNWCNDVSILLGKGDGTFLPPAFYETGQSSFGPVVGDFNGDGKQDLLLISWDSYSLLFGNGNGTFQPAITHALGSATTYLNNYAVGDFNQDGKLDLAVTYYNIDPNIPETKIYVYLGDGQGNFLFSASFEIGAESGNLAVADFDGDGHLDLAVNLLTNPSTWTWTIGIMLGNGQGNFQPPATIPSFNYPFYSVGEFNRDGKPDLLAGDYFNKNLYVLLNITTYSPYGGLATAQHLGAGTGPGAVTSGDFNGDGHLDLASADWGSNSASVLLGNGDGTFQAAAHFPAGNTPNAITSGDFNRDGKLDLAVTNYDEAKVLVLLGNGNGTFAPPLAYDVGANPFSVATADFNRDGILDLVVANFTDNNISILLGKGDGTFTPATPPTINVGNSPCSVIIGDFNRDGKPDLAVANRTDSTVSILLGVGDGTFYPATPPTVPGAFLGRTITCGDFDGDGKLDLASASWGSNSIYILRGNGDGTFTLLSPITVGFNLFGIISGDFNRDGKTDLAVTRYSDSIVSLLLGNGNGTFQTATDFSTETKPQWLTLGDFNGDGKPDLAVGTDGNINVLLNKLCIFSSAGANGTIDPQGNTFVEARHSKTFTFTPEAGYHVANLVVDGVSLGAVFWPWYTFSNVTTNHTIEVTFAINTLTINASAGANGTISPSGAVTVNYGASQTFNFNPSAGYHVADVVVDGGSVGAPSFYTFNNVTADHTISVSFALSSCSVSNLKINNGAAYTKSGTVALTYTITYTPTHYRTSSNGTSWSSWTTPVPASLPAFSLGTTNGQKDIYMQVKDATNVSPVVRATIILDTTAPTGAIQINNGNAAVTKTGNTTNVTLTITASDAISGIDKMAINQTGATPAPGDYIAFAPTVANYPLDTTTTGTKTVNIWFMDKAGNISAKKSDSITVNP